jgi:superfamily II DNA helicase RecQ
MQVRTTAQLAYMSPEMVLSPSFQRLWKDANFRSRLTALVVDEAHCIEEWGGLDFRPQYRRLDILRTYTGQEVPILACTGTCRTSTFNLIWETLGYGYRPFWGLDVGTDRPNLYFIVRPLPDAKNPLLDVLNLLPKIMDSKTALVDIPKSILYFDSEDMCRTLVRLLRQVLPSHLREYVQAFSSDLEEDTKGAIWDSFRKGQTRILCATDAAGMGCNVPDIKYIVSFGLPKATSSVGQRWGRAGRDRKTEAVCILLAPAWAFRPSTSATLQQQLNGQRRKPERKQATIQRAKLDSRLESFINTTSSEPPGKFHFV